MESKAWEGVLAGMVLGLERAADAAVFTPAEVVTEADRLLNHPNGCNEDARRRLIDLRRRALALLN